MKRHMGAKNKEGRPSSGHGKRARGCRMRWRGLKILAEPCRLRLNGGPDLRQDVSTSPSESGLQMSEQHYE